jgi:hypothetical protein
MWHTSARWTYVYQPQSQRPLQIPPVWTEQRDLRREYREERESELKTDLEAAKVAEESAVAMAQMVIKSGLILNGGGIIAIPAVATLFNLAADKLLQQLILTGGLFIGGLFTACAASVFGFFALAHKSELSYSNAVQTARTVQGKYFPAQAKEMAVQAEAAGKRGKRLRVMFLAERYVAIVLCLISVALFVAGASVGGWAILKAPHKAEYVPPDAPLPTALYR